MTTPLTNGDDVKTVAYSVAGTEDPRTGVTYVTLTAALPPLTPGGRAFMEDLARRLGELAALIVRDKLEATDPRLQIPAAFVRELAPPAELLETMGPTWLHTLLLELVEGRRQVSRAWAEGRPARERGHVLESMDDLTAYEHLRIAQTILLHELDASGDVRYALEHLEAAIVAVEQP